MSPGGCVGSSHALLLCEGCMIWEHGKTFGHDKDKKEKGNWFHWIALYGVRHYARCFTKCIISFGLHSSPVTWCVILILWIEKLRARNSKICRAQRTMSNAFRLTPEAVWFQSSLQYMGSVLPNWCSVTTYLTDEWVNYRETHAVLLF